MIKYYKGRGDILKVEKDLIIKNLDDRKNEIALFAVAYDFDTDMLKSLITSGHLKTFMTSKK